MGLEQTDMASVAKFITDLEASCDRLDHVIVNAGVALQDFTLSRNGYEAW